MIYGRGKPALNASDGVLELKEISLRFEAYDIEAIASFLGEAAKRMRSGALRPGSHRHMDQVVPGWSLTHACDIIVSRPGDVRSSAPVVNPET